MKWSKALLVGLLLGSIAGTAQDLSYGLVAYYSFCGCTATDHSGNGNDAQLVGNPRCRDGIRGQGMQFNLNAGTNDCGQRGGEYVRLPELESIWDGGFSVGAWVQYENIANYERIIDLGNGSGESGGLPVWFGREGNSNNLTLESWVDADPGPNRSTGRLVAVDAITNGQIEFYCATIDNRTMRIYVNGELVAEKEGHPIRNVRRSENFIGHSNWCQADPDFAGFVDEVRLYNRALSAEEIRLLYERPALLSGPDEVCIGVPAELQAQGGVRYEWTPGTFLDRTDIANPLAIADRDTSMAYQVTISFPDGCLATDTLQLHFRDCTDCAGIADGTALIDDCGVCRSTDDPNFNQSCLDCAGVPNGGAVLDSCGVCLKVDSPDFNQSCTDCLGQPNGGAVLNACGQCLQAGDPRLISDCVEQNEVFIPNAFSPNRDGINDELGVYGEAALVEKIELFRVRDRWGNLVFEAQNVDLGQPQAFWKGRQGGKICPQGVYLYQAVIHFTNGQRRVFTGSTTLFY